MRNWHKRQGRPRLFNDGILRYIRRHDDLRVSDRDTNYQPGVPGGLSAAGAAGFLRASKDPRAFSVS